MADDDDDVPEAATDDDGPGADEAPEGDIAEAWRNEFSEELTWDGLVRWLSQ